jgi:hypothetical protein
MSVSCEQVGFETPKQQVVLAAVGYVSWYCASGLSVR